SARRPHASLLRASSQHCDAVAAFVSLSTSAAAGVDIVASHCCSSVPFTLESAVFELNFVSGRRTLLAATSAGPMDMVTRRRFVIQTAPVTAAPSISTRVTRALAAASREKLGFALCGLGSLSTNQIAPALQKTEHCRLAGIITGTPEKAVRWKARYNIPDKNIYN